ncbi:hypothetical protein PV325_011187 [Microctonus aethiopoides]|nr:hypothetical protein PV325_011187 [Microctonus aethiopoides]
MGLGISYEVQRTLRSMEVGHKFRPRGVYLNIEFDKKKRNDSDKRLFNKVQESSNANHRQEEAYNISLSKQCSTFTAEAPAIKAALEQMVKEAQARNEEI